MSRKKGYKVTEEAKKKISIANSGKNNGMYGKVVSEETRKKIGLKSKGRKPALGMIHTEEAKAKMSKARIGNKNAVGTKHTNKWKEKMSKLHKGNKYCLGRKHTEKWKQDNSLRMTGNKYNKGLKKEKNPNWKGGITSKNELIRKSNEYLLWRKSVFQRDNFICQKTKKSGGDLEAHHINNFAEFPELQLAIDNGITLSKKSHKEFHKKYGYKNNTKEQIIEFLIK